MISLLSRTLLLPSAAAAAAAAPVRVVLRSVAGEARSALAAAGSCASLLARCKHTQTPLRSQSIAYAAVPSAERALYVPPPRGSISEPAAFLKAIGRNSESVAAKFKDWDHLFTATSKELETLGIKTQMRKYILGWREWYKRGVEPKAIELPKRQKKYLKRQAEVKRARLQKLGLI
ncbi:telomere length regulation protein [Polyrhizophydium stewartii]|uniref:Small ribosomal subunit protein mS41 n=1 Tax=Polyrhizophydium stewartii TaxID=2732419 RepID=A0ABR4N3T7_9FUNG